MIIKKQTELANPLNKISAVETVDEVLKIALTKELKKIEWAEVDNISGVKKEDKSQASIQ